MTSYKRCSVALSYITTQYNFAKQVGVAADPVGCLSIKKISNPIEFQTIRNIAQVKHTCKSTF